MRKIDRLDKVFSILFKFVAMPLAFYFAFQFLIAWSGGAA